MSDLESVPPPDPLPPQPVEESLIVDQAQVAPQADKTAADMGTKLFVIFFMLVIPPLGIVMVAAMVWSLWKLVMSNA